MTGAADRTTTAVESPTLELSLAGAVDHSAALMDAFAERGAVLAHSAPVDVAWFRDITDALGHGFIRHPSDNRPQMGAVETIQHVDFGVRSIPLHAERSQTVLRPTVCWFFCLNPPDSGGETLVCDGAEVVARVSPQLRTLVAGRGLRYRKTIELDRIQALLGGVSADDAWAALAREPLARTFRRVSDEIVEQDAVMPFFDDSTGVPAFANYLLYARLVKDDRTYPTFEDGTPVPDEIVEEIRHVADSLTTAVTWRAGDLLMIDNRRFMHGRAEVVNPEQRRIVSRFGHLRSTPLPSAS